MFPYYHLREVCLLIFGPFTIRFLTETQAIRTDQTRAEMKCGVTNCIILLGIAVQLCFVKQEETKRRLCMAVASCLFVPVEIDIYIRLRTRVCDQTLAYRKVRC